MPTQTPNNPRTGRLIVVAIAMRLVVDTAVRLFYPFLPEISRGLGITLSQGGLLLALRSAMVFPSPLFGAWSDRHGPRGLLTAALLTQAVGLWWLSTAQGLASAIPPIILLGLASTAFIPNLQATVAAHVPFHRRGRVVGIIEFSWAITGLVILPLVGITMVQAGWQAPLRILAGLSLAVAPLPSLLPRGHRPAATVGRSFRQLAGAVWQSPSARAAILVNGLIFVAAESFFVTYGAWLEQSFGMAPNQIGRVAALLGLAELLASGGSSLFIDRLGKRRGVGLGLAAMTLTLALLPLLERSQALAVAGMAVFTLAFEWSIVSHISLLSEQAPLARGTVLSLAVVAGGIARTVSDYLAVVLFEQGGMLATVLFGVAGAALALFVLRRWVQERAAEPGEVAAAS
ncbi:MAG: MFS transporter [Anaerolinea sp.]|nr:MFS transporter [Anaerolinea sp.]